MMDGDVARESNANDDFDVIGDDGRQNSSGGGGVAVSVEVGLVANGDGESISKRPVDEEFSKPAMNGDEVEEGQIEHMRIENGDSLDDKPKACAEDLMNEFGISLDSGVQDEAADDNADESSATGNIVEEDEVAATTSKTEESSITLDLLSKEQTAGESDGQAEISVEFGLNGQDKADEPASEDTSAEATQDIPDDIPKHIQTEEEEEDAPKETPEPEVETTQDSAVDVSLGTSQDTSLDISQDVSFDASLDKQQEPAEEESSKIDEDGESGTVEEETAQTFDEVQDEEAKGETIEVCLDQSREVGEEDVSEDSDQVPPITSPTSPKPILQRLLSWEKAAKEPPKPRGSVAGRYNPSAPKNDGFRPPLTRSKSNKLDSSKLSRFESSSAHSSDSEGSISSKRHTISGTGKLNFARFAAFEKKNQESTDGAPAIKRGAGTRSKSLKYGSAAVQSELCHVCQKRVYPMEKITADSIVYHKTCFRCAECKKCLSLGKYAACKGNVFCLPHFKQNFKLKGNYDFTNQPATPRQTNGISDSDDNIDSINADRSMDGSMLDESPRLADQPISPTQNQVEESSPPSVVKASDRPDELMSPEGGTGSVKARFEQGEVHNITTSGGGQPVNIFEAPQEKGVSENQPVHRDDVILSSKPADEVKAVKGGIGNLKSLFEKGGVTNVEAKVSPREPVSIGSLEDFQSSGQGHVSESTPVIRDDVVRSSDNFEDPGIKLGFSKSLKNRFETERVSNVEEKPKEKIEITMSEERRVYQPPQREQREDVINAQSQHEDPGIKSGQARSLRSLFEKGNVSNVQEKPKPGLEREPKMLEDFKSESQVSESTPVVKDDVISGATHIDEPMKPSESTRAMKQRWEAGQVEHVPEKPKPALEREPHSLESYSMSMVVSENTPEERDDIVKSSTNNEDYLSSPDASSVKAKWETGDVFNAEVEVEKSDSAPVKITDNHDAEEQPNGIGGQENGVNGDVVEDEEEVEDASWEIKKERLAMANLDDDDE